MKQDDQPSFQASRKGPMKRGGLRSAQTWRTKLPAVPFPSLKTAIANLPHAAKMRKSRTSALRTVLSHASCRAIETSRGQKKKARHSADHGAMAGGSERLTAQPAEVLIGRLVTPGIFESHGVPATMMRCTRPSPNSPYSALIQPDLRE